MKKTNLSEVVSNIHTPPPSKTAKRMAKRMGLNVGLRLVETEDPIVELRRLVSLHKRWTNTAKSWKQSVSDRKNRETGEPILCTLPLALRAEVENACKTLKHESEALKRDMLKQLAQIPIYKEFLSKVPGLGPVTCAYLTAMVKIDRCPNVSQLIRYCGFATGPNGKAERRDGGPKYAPDGSLTGGTGTYNADLKISLVVCFMMMRQSCAKKRATHRYLRRWDEAKASALTLPNPRLGRVMHDGEADDKGRRKATDLLLWDLYVMWRTLEGLPIRPDKYSAVRGHYHNGQEARDALYTLTIEEARAMVEL